ncbi:spore germination protein KC [Scopulibacillus darangshiensis]|uniref:Spore germination protein KC n=1 Tax=Scopulibacillus darangshiensis TaxID=442528 RepID=A0A4R2NM39_9BACL|nr:Ger(x)C family spore germination protein [Scopulibacillus darangshiensis]TCP22660.1 spore germination protein KC [Scopulibacillus darangshiensis]
MNRCFVFSMIVVIAFILNGCWDAYELDQIGIVTGVAIDKGEAKKLKMSVEIINAPELSPQQSKGNSSTVVYGLEGNSVAELSHKMNVAVSKKLDFSHLQTLVIGESVAREGLLDFLDYFESSKETRNDFDFIIAKKVSAEDLMSTTYPTENIPSMKIYSQLETGSKEWGTYPRVRMKDIITAMVSEGRQPVIPVATVTGSIEEGINVENRKNVEPKAIVTFTNLGVFKGDKLLGYLSLDDTRNYLWTQNKLKFTSISVPCGKNKFFTVRAYHSQTNIKANYRKGEPNIKLNIEMEARLDEIHCHADITKSNVYKKLEKKIEDHVEQKMTATINKVQNKYKIDIFGFGDVMNRQDYQAFKKVKNKWDEEFTRADIAVNVKVNLRRAGVRTKSFLTELKNE